MEKKSEYGLVKVIFKTFKTFFRSDLNGAFKMLFLSLLPALISPIKVICENYIFEEAEKVVLLQTIDWSNYWWFLALIIVQIVYLGIYSLYRSNINYIGSDLEINLQNNLNAKTANIPLEMFDDPSFYKNIELARNVSRDLRFMVMMFVSEIFSYIITFISVTGVMFSYHYALVLLSIFAILPDIVAKILQSKYRYNAMDRLQESIRGKKYFEDILTNVKSQKEIRIYKSHKFFLSKWNAFQSDFSHEKKKLIKYQFNLNSICSICMTITSIASLLLIICLVLAGEIKIGEFAASFNATILLKTNFSRILNLGIFSLDCGLKGKYYYSVMNYPERIRNTVADITPKEGIKFENVFFAYQKQNDVIKDISCKIDPGMIVAVVGENGAGKSTFSKLLLGLYLPDKGSITYSGNKTKDIEEENLYKNLSAVFQEFCKYNFTVAENVVFSNLPNSSTIQKVLKILQDLDFKIQGEEILAEDLNLQLGIEYGGIELSGGNWQKLAIARGLQKKHQLIVLDEPTSSIDSLTEEKIFHEILFDNSKATKVFITHHMSTTALADYIIVLDHGSIVEAGTHKELLDKKGTYEKLWNSQAKWYK